MSLQPSLYPEGNWGAQPSDNLHVNKEMLCELLRETAAAEDILSLRSALASLRDAITVPRSDRRGLRNIEASGDTVSLRACALLAEIQQAFDARTLERARYYVNRLLVGIEHVRTNKINDINLGRWKEYDEVITDSLWIFDRRDNSGVHMAGYWGNFVPQIPRQLMLRYSRRGEWVLDPFLGSGTTLIECRRLGRNGIGVELGPHVAQAARALIGKQAAEAAVVTDVIVGDSRTADIAATLASHGVSKVQLVIMHPPYHDIIKFSDDPRDLSTARSEEDFLEGFGAVVDNVTPSLEPGRFLGVVIGDKYSKGEWIPLGFHCMEEVLKRPFKLKSIIVKNFEETRAKRNQSALWRYRALVGGFYVFKHEYVLLFQKRRM